MAAKIGRSSSSQKNGCSNIKNLSNRSPKPSTRSTRNNRDWSRTFSVDTLVESIRQGHYKRIVVLVGAGISTASGIPDFRTPTTGLYNNLGRYNIPYAEAIFELNYFNKNPTPFFNLAKELYPGKYLPNLVHYFIRYLSDENVLHRVYTQNIDGLERIAGIPAEKIVEAHGTFQTATCQKCRQKYSCQDICQDIFQDRIPTCFKTRHCSGIIKPDIVFFGEDLPRRFQLYLHDLPSCDCCLVMGTSLAVYPFADIIDLTKRSTTRLLINRQVVGAFLSPRPYDLILVGDLETNIKQLLTKMNVLDKVVELMKRQNELVQSNSGYRNSYQVKNATTTHDDRLKAAERLIEEKTKQTSVNHNGKRRQSILSSTPVCTESNRLLIERHNNALLFNRRRSKSVLPVLPPRNSSSSSSSSSSNSSLSDYEITPFSFRKPSQEKTQNGRILIQKAKANVKLDSLLSSTLRVPL